MNNVQFIIFTIYYFTIFNSKPCPTPVDNDFVQYFSMERNEENKKT